LRIFLFFHKEYTFYNVILIRRVEYVLSTQRDSETSLSTKFCCLEEERSTQPNGCNVTERVKEQDVQVTWAFWESDTACMLECEQAWSVSRHEPFQGEERTLKPRSSDIQRHDAEKML
jgi:hypothetical protein